MTWKYPGCILKGDNSVGEFYSVAVTNNHQQADTGTKMIHIGKNTRSKIISKGISAGTRRTATAGWSRSPRTPRARATTPVRLDAHRGRAARTPSPTSTCSNPTAQVEHEATTSKIGEEQIFYFQQRGHRRGGRHLDDHLGFCKEVFHELPMEFAVEAQKLLGIKLEGSVG